MAISIFSVHFIYGHFYFFRLSLGCGWAKGDQISARSEYQVKEKLNFEQTPYWSELYVTQTVPLVTLRLIYM
jgi:hypothetical protein